MKRILTTCLSVLLVATATGEDRSQPDPSGIRGSLARELADALGRLYPDDGFTATDLHLSWPTSPQAFI